LSYYLCLDYTAWFLRVSIRDELIFAVVHHIPLNQQSPGFVPPFSFRDTVRSEIILMIRIIT